MRSRSLIRHYNWIKAIRKRNIDRNCCTYYSSSGYYDNLHQYSKNKIHCSCSMCATKTKNKGHNRNKAGNYNKSVNYKISDLRKINRMNYIEQDFLDRAI